MVIKEDGWPKMEIKVGTFDSWVECYERELTKEEAKFVEDWLASKRENDVGNQATSDGPQ